MTITGLFEPPPSEATGPYRGATRERRLVVPWCPACDRAFWAPREVCPSCLDPGVEWRQAAGTGVVHASVHRRPARAGTRMTGPYVVALVELAERVRLMTNVVGCPPDDVTVGMAVTVAWHPLFDGRHLPFFTPA